MSLGRRLSYLEVSYPMCAHYGLRSYGSETEPCLPPSLMFPSFPNIVPTLSFKILQNVLPTVLLKSVIPRQFSGSGLSPFLNKFTATPSLHLFGACSFFHHASNYTTYPSSSWVSIPSPPYFLNSFTLFDLPLLAFYS